MPQTWDFDCAIIGGGPGGLVAALYLARFKRKIVLFNVGKPRAAWAPKIKNLIGYYKGVSGQRLLTMLNHQLDEFSNLARIELEAQIKRIPGGFEVSDKEGVRFKTKTVILATGITDIQPEIDNVKELRTLGLVRYCSICDGYEARNQPITVLAKDDFGIQKAIFIGNWTRKIRVLVPKELTLAPQRLSEIKEAQVTIIRCTTFRLEVSRTRDSIWVFADRKEPYLSSIVYVELGSKINDPAFYNLKNLRRTKQGFLITTTEQKTSIKGLFAVGDCVNLLGQISVAAGQAAVAAVSIHNDLLG